MSFDRPFDAVFSNAVLDCVRPPEAAIARVHAALFPGGCFVLEMGGIGNVAAVLRSADTAARPVLFNNGQWFADYRRLRVRAVRR